MNHWFTADTHFGSKNIISRCSRPFGSAEEMNERIIENFRSVYRPGDVLYHLGDLANSFFNVNTFFAHFKNVKFVYGNHDDEKHVQHPHVRKYAVIDDVKIDGTRVVLCHYAMRSWLGKHSGGFQLYGHSHGRLLGEGRQMDVGVDTHDFYPWHFEEIRGLLKQISYGAEA